MTRDPGERAVADGENLDPRTVEGFGAEWTLFDYGVPHEPEIAEAFRAYFSIFPWDSLPQNAVGMDVGCGSGRWARFVAPRVGVLHCIDASGDALAIAERNLAGLSNCVCDLASVDRLPVPDGSLDFAYCLGVLHHVPDTEGGIRAIATKLKQGAPFLIYLYYALDGRPWWYRGVWKTSDVIRQLVASRGFRFRRMVAMGMAALVYWPLARIARLAETAGADVEKVPLSAYRDRSFYLMKTDALDRFGTRLEKRFTKEQIRDMMTNAGFTGLQFSDRRPYWLCLGWKK